MPFLFACSPGSHTTKPALPLTDRARAGLIGPVKAVLTEDAVLAETNGQWLEIQQASSLSRYDESGNRIEQAPFRASLPGGFATTQHEAFFHPEANGSVQLDPATKKYFKLDGKGNVLEQGVYDPPNQRAEVSMLPNKPADLTSAALQAMTDGERFFFLHREGAEDRVHGFKNRIREDALWQLAMYLRQLPRAQAAGTTVAVAAPTPSAKITASEEKRYTLRGKVVSIERELRQVTVEHEEIKGYMEAMTMPFPLKDEKALGRLKKDDRIEATLIVNTRGWRLENVAIK